MRVVVAPDSFGGTLSAVEAATAVADGWHEVAPDDDVVLLPLSDGGPGFVDVLGASLGGDRRPCTVCGPLGASTAAEVLVVGDVAYVEAAHAAGLHLLDVNERDPRRTTTFGVGELVTVAAAGVNRVVVGLGGTATNDGGAGLWAALGAEPSALLRAGGGALVDLPEVFPPHPLPAGVVVATDVDNPLLGPNGASAVYGPQKGAGRAAVLDLDDALRRWAELVEAVTGWQGLRDQPGAGAAGGLGFGLLALGAAQASGFGVVADALGLAGRLAGADLLVTGEGSFDSQSLRGKVVSGAAAAAQQAGLPCIVIAGQVAVGRQDAAAAGVDDAYAVADTLGSADAALTAGAAGVRETAARVARLWSTRPARP
ncbi:MAG: glycerate 2-kinase [Frankiaceae bacterium]|nr:glycerate 2-kinase [Frankiaceae bacterium]